MEGLDRSTGGELGKDGWISPIRRGDARTPADAAAVDVVDGDDMLDSIGSKSQKHNDTVQCMSRSSSPLFADVTLTPLLHLSLMK